MLYLKGFPISLSTVLLSIVFWTMSEIDVLKAELVKLQDEMRSLKGSMVPGWSKTGESSASAHTPACRKSKPPKYSGKGTPFINEWLICIETYCSDATDRDTVEIA